MTIAARDPTVPLDGEWIFATDPDDVGEDEGWYEPGREWPDPQSVDVPHAWQELENLREYTGTGWYRRTFDAPPTAGDERALLRFNAVDYRATVWVNGERIGDHTGGYLPFALDATDALYEEDNTVVLRVEDPEDLSEIPHGKQGEPWYTRVSGPWQRVDLVVLPTTRVESARATPELDDDSVSFDIETVGDGARSTTVTVERDGRSVGEATTAIEAGSGSVTIELEDPIYWTPDDPALYDFTVTVEDASGLLDRYEDYFGMRSIDAEDGHLLLNGERLQLRGALDQAYYPDTFYRPADLGTFREEIETAKELGFNMLRKHIKPAHPEFVELADRIGILVWQEPANPSLFTDASKRAVREQFRGMIERDYNRPSVVVWSLYNEEWGVGGHPEEEPLWTDREKQEYIAEFYETALEWDPTRLVCDNSGWAHVATDLNDYHPYFVSPDRADAWREHLDDILAHPEENYGATATDPDDAPIVISEFGTWGLPTVSRLRQHYDGDPHWFDHDFLEGLKRPAGVDERFESAAVSGAFDDLDDLGAAWQRREHQSVADIIATMRVRDEIAGYVITEFTDIEWEFNGMLDYGRESKAFYDDFAAVNAPVMARADPEHHTFWAGETLTADLVLVNDTPGTIDATADWEAFDESGRIAVSLDGVGTTRIKDAIEVEAPDVETVRTAEVSVSLDTVDASGTTEIVVAPRTDAPDVTVSADAEALVDALAERGYEVVDPDEADVAIVTSDAAPEGPTLRLPNRDGYMTGEGYVDLPERDSWNLCACFVYQTLLPAVGRVPGWAFEDLYPYAYVPDPDGEVIVGYTEGWIANSGGIVVPDGADVTCTLRVTDVYGEHPVATAVLDRLVADLAGD